MTTPTINEPTKSSLPTETPEQRRAKNHAAIAALDEWMADESGYDEETWPKLKKALEESHDTDRRFFSE